MSDKKYSSAELISGAKATVGAWLAPLLTGLCGLALIVSAGDPSPTGIPGLLILSGVCFFSTFWAVRRLCRYHAVVSQQRSAHAEVADLCVQLLPLWSEQIATGQQQTETAVMELVTRFADLSRRLEAAVEAPHLTASSNDRQRQSVLNLLVASRTDLGSIIDSLKSALEAMATMMKQISTLSDFTGDLKSMANAVGNIAAQTNLLAINASIEAARAGPAGRGFAVVAQEVRQLSEQSAETGKQISSHVDSVSAAVANVLEHAGQYARHEAAAVDASEQTIRRVLDDFNASAEELTESTKAMRAENACIKLEIDEVLVSLQFQDRVGQILGHVRENLEKLQVRLEQYRESPVNGETYPEIDVAKWLQDLSETYTTHEQRAIHSGTRVGNSQASEITFF